MDHETQKQPFLFAIALLFTLILPLAAITVISSQTDEGMQSRHLVHHISPGA